MSSIPQNESFDEEEESCSSKNGDKRSQLQHEQQKMQDDCSGTITSAAATVESTPQKPLVPPRNSSLPENKAK